MGNVLAVAAEKHRGGAISTGGRGHIIGAVHPAVDAPARGASFAATSCALQQEYSLQARAQFVAGTAVDDCRHDAGQAPGPPRAPFGTGPTAAPHGHAPPHGMKIAPIFAL